LPSKEEISKLQKIEANPSFKKLERKANFYERMEKFLEIKRFSLKKHQGPVWLWIPQTFNVIFPPPHPQGEKKPIFHSPL